MTDYTICDDWGEGSGLELHEKGCNEDRIGEIVHCTLSSGNLYLSYFYSVIIPLFQGD